MYWLRTVFNTLVYGTGAIVWLMISAVAVRPWIKTGAQVRKLVYWQSRGILFFMRLKRDLKASKIFIADDGDIMRVNKILEVKPEEFDENFAYLLFDTNRVYYSIRFKVERSF